MRFFEEVPAVYLHREPVDFRNYAELIVMRSRGGERARKRPFRPNLRRIIMGVNRALQHRQKFVWCAESASLDGR